jgi:hypothetical protein
VIGRRWTTPSEIPKRPYRDSAILYAVLSVVIVVVAFATGGDVVRAVLFAVGFFAVATAWSFWRWRERIRANERERRRREEWRAEQEARVTRGDPP